MQKATDDQGDQGAVRQDRAWLIDSRNYWETQCRAAEREMVKSDQRAERLEAALRLTRTHDEHVNNCRIEGCRQCDDLRIAVVDARCEALGDFANPQVGCAPVSSDSGIAGLPSAAQKRSNNSGLMKETDADQDVQEPSLYERLTAGELLDGLDEAADWIEAHGSMDHQTPWLIHRDVVREAMRRVQVGCETDSAPSKDQVLKKKEDSGGTRLTAGAGVSVSASDQLSHDAPTSRCCGAAVEDAGECSDGCCDRFRCTKCGKTWYCEVPQ